MLKPLTILVSIIALLSLVACNAGGDTPTAATVSGGDGTASPYQLLIASSDITAEDNRVALTFWDGPARFTGGETLTVAIYLVDAEGAAGDKLWEGDAT